jgi:hypothetical protein
VSGRSFLAANKTCSIDVILTTNNFAMAQTMAPLVKPDRGSDFDRGRAAMQPPLAAPAALKWPLCGTCKGVGPQGLPVSDRLRYLTYSEGYWESAPARENYQAMPAEAQARRAVKCPNGIRANGRLLRVQELFA